MKISRFYEHLKSDYCGLLRDIYSPIEDDLNIISLVVRNSFISQHYNPNYHDDRWDDFNQPPSIVWIRNQMRENNFGFVIKTIDIKKIPLYILTIDHRNRIDQLELDKLTRRSKEDGFFQIADTKSICRGDICKRAFILRSIFTIINS